MDLTLSPNEQAFRDELRAWLEENHPGEAPAGDEAAFEFRRDWQRKMADAGYAGLSWPKEYGGRGATLVEQALFNELFIEEARIADENIVGGVGNGWTVAITTLMHERAGLGFGSAVQLKITAGELGELIRERGLQEDPLVRQRYAQLLIEAECIRLNASRGLTKIMKTGAPGPEGSLPKWQWSDANQALSELAVDVLGDEAPAVHDEWTYRFLRARANSIEGGTTEILKNIIAERVLGLPRLR